MKQGNRSNCLFSYSLEIWGDRWSLLIIRDMIFSGKNTYGELLKSPEGIATNILANRLQKLEENGIISKTIHPDSKAKNLYTLTAKGIDLLPILVEIYLWAEKFQPVSDTVKERMKIFKEDKQGAINALTNELKKRTEKK